MDNFNLPAGISIKDPEKLHQAILNLVRDAKVKGRAGSTNLRAVRCDVDGLTLGHFYDLWEALGEDVCKAINSTGASDTALDAAASSVTEYITTVINDARTADKDVLEEGTVYYNTFRSMLRKCGISNDEMRRRIREYCNRRFEVQSESNGNVGNLNRAACHPGMKIQSFKILIAAVFPE